MAIYENDTKWQQTRMVIMGLEQMLEELKKRTEARENTTGEDYELITRVEYLLHRSKIILKQIERSVYWEELEACRKVVKNISDEIVLHNFND